MFELIIEMQISGQIMSRKKNGDISKSILHKLHDKFQGLCCYGELVIWIFYS